MLDTVAIGAIATAIGSVIGVIGKVIVDVYRAKKEPDESDLKLKEDLENEKAIAAQQRQAFHDAIDEIRNMVIEQYKNLGEKIDKIDSKTQQHKNIAVVELRHSITEVYYQYREKKCFPLNAKEDVCSLYSAYTELGGNSYVHQIYDEMMTWETE